MDFLVELVDSVKGTAHVGVLAGDVVTVVGEVLAWLQDGSLAHYLVPLDDDFCAVLVLDEPFPSEEAHRTIGKVGYGNEINEGMGLGRRQINGVFVIDQFVQRDAETFQFGAF